MITGLDTNVCTSSTGIKSVPNSRAFCRFFLAACIIAASGIHPPKNYKK